MFPQIPFTFIRHGQTDWNVEHRLQGHTDVPLNATGQNQAKEAIAKLQNQRFKTIITSPLKRAHETATIITEGLNLKTNLIHTDDNLKERTFGILEGHTYTELEAKYGLTIDQLNAPTTLYEGLEAWTDVRKRASQSIQKWLLEKGENTLFVGHGAFMIGLLEELTGESFKAKNATPYLFEPTPSGWRISEIE